MYGYPKGRKNGRNSKKMSPTRKAYIAGLRAGKRIARRKKPKYNNKKRWY